jgi:cell wall-associated NlpC family hydrolase
MTRVPLHAPRAAPGAVALRAADRRQVGLALGLAWLVVAGAVGVAAAGAHRPAVALGPAEPVAGVTVSDVVASSTDDPGVDAGGLAMPHDPTAARRWSGTFTATLEMVPIPAFVGLDDPPGLGPAPAVDPAVAALLAQLSRDAKGSPSDPRPGPQALVALDFALAQVGRPYVWGATGPASYDCSGLTWQSYSQAGITLPRVSADQHANGGPPVAIADLLPGDLVFFATAAWDPGAVHHVGMYVGHGLMVDAPHPGAFVRVEPVSAAGYVGAVRVVPERPGPPAPTRPTKPAGPSSATPTAQPSVPTPATTPTPSDPPPPSDTPTPPPSDTPTPPPSDTPTPPPSDTPTAPPSATDPATAPPTDPATAPPTSPATAPPTSPAADPTTTTPSAGTATPVG